MAPCWHQHGPMLGQKNRLDASWAVWEASWAVSETVQNRSENLSEIIPQIHHYQKPTQELLSN